MCTLNQVEEREEKLHSNYLEVTGDILGFLKYESKFNTEECKK